MGETLHRTHAAPGKAVTRPIAYPTMVRTLDNALADMSEVMDAWLSVRSVAQATLVTGADEAVMAMAGLRESPAREWWHPRRREQGQLHAEAGQRFNEALAELVRLTIADSGRTRAERRAAQRRAVVG